MRIRSLLLWVASLCGGALAAGSVLAQDAAEAPKPHYGDIPDALVPYRRSGEPFRRFFTEAPEFRGPGRELPEPEGLKDVRVGVILPYAGVEVHLGRNMNQGVTLAIEEANAGGGYKGLPFVPVVRDESQAWAAAADAIVDFGFSLGAWAVIGAVDDNASHVMSRVVLKAEIPIVNTAGADPTLTEHMVPWLARLRPDDRRNGYALAERVFLRDGRTRVAVFRENSRYGRMGIREFVDSARRLGTPVVLEVRYVASETSWETQIARLRDEKPDAILMWGAAEVTGRVLRAVRAAGIDAQVYGPDRLHDPEFVRAAGAAAEGAVVAVPFDPTEDRPAWTAFREKYRARFQAEPDAAAAYGYDGTNYLVEAIRRAGLNRVRIRDELFAPAEWEGVTGTVRFDINHNNVAPVALLRCVGGEFRRD